jgi:hypothetical protein
MFASIHPPDFKPLVEELLAESRAHRADPTEALRLVIERHGLTDYEGVCLFSALKNASRESEFAA